MAALTAQQQRSIAYRLLSHHDCGGSRLIIARENCSGCVLNGYHPSREKHDGRPNYSGWLRVYIQAGRRFTIKAATLELTEAQQGHTYPDGFTSSPNLAYYNAILDDAETFGCPNTRSDCPVCAALAARKEQPA